MSEQNSLGIENITGNTIDDIIALKDRNIVRTNIILEHHEVQKAYFSTCFYCTKYYQILANYDSLNDFLLHPLPPSTKRTVNKIVEKEHDLGIFPHSKKYFMACVNKFRTWFQAYTLTNPHETISTFVKTHKEKTRFYCKDMLGKAADSIDDSIIATEEEEDNTNKEEDNTSKKPRQSA